MKLLPVPQATSRTVSPWSPLAAPSFAAGCSIQSSVVVVGGEVVVDGRDRLVGDLGACRLSARHLSGGGLHVGLRPGLSSLAFQMFYPRIPFIVSFEPRGSCKFARSTLRGTIRTKVTMAGSGVRHRGSVCGWPIATRAIRARRRTSRRRPAPRLASPLDPARLRQPQAVAGDDRPQRGLPPLLAAAPRPDRRGRAGRGGRGGAGPRDGRTGRPAGGAGAALGARAGAARDALRGGSDPARDRRPAGDPGGHGQGAAAPGADEAAPRLRLLTRSSIRASEIPLYTRASAAGPSSDGWIRTRAGRRGDY